MTTKIVPPTFITQSEEIYDKGYDPNVARGLLRFLKPYTGQMLLSLLLHDHCDSRLGGGTVLCQAGDR